MANNLGNLVRQIRIDTAYGPPIVLDQPFSPAAQAGGPSALKWLKPRITIVPNIDGMDPIVSEPWGAPGPTRWPQVQLAMVLGGALSLGLMGYGIYRALK